MGKKRKKLVGTVKKVITPLIPSEPEKVEIGIDDADPLYREIRIENAVTNRNGVKSRLRPGARVDVILEADSSATLKKPDKS